MTLAWISVGALVLAVALSVLTTINVGILSLAMAWLVGVYLGGMSVNSVLSGFPVPLLVTLVGVTLLFSMADTNGTLSRLTGRAVRLCRGNAGLLPVMFFALGVVVSTIGPWWHTCQRPAGGARHGGRGEGGHFAAADGAHGWQWRVGGHAVAVCAWRHHRQ